MNDHESTCSLCALHGTKERPLVTIGDDIVAHIDCWRGASLARERDGLTDIDAEYNQEILRAHMRWRSDPTVKALAALRLWRHTGCTTGEGAKALGLDLLGFRGLVVDLGIEQD